MTTLTLNQPVTLRNILDDDFEPSIPSFMEHSFGHASILVRHKDDLHFTEQWCEVGGYIHGANSATDVDLEAYNHEHDVAMLETIDELPEPISVHDQDVWLECVSGEYDAFVSEFQHHQYGDDERMYG